MPTVRQTPLNVALSGGLLCRPRRIAGNVVAAALALYVTAAALPAQAQASSAEPAAVSADRANATPPPPAAKTPDEIRVRKAVEVTATRGTLAEDTSAAATAEVSRAEFEKRSPRTVDQALVGVGGVTTFRARGLPDSGVGVGLRGFSGRSSGQGRVLVLLDGQPLNDAISGR
ncbi:MAG: Plug domain-containing protein [Holophagales bacterium]|nr:Plug domain-containing protein [Holophagales bacterium]